MELFDIKYLVLLYLTKPVYKILPGLADIFSDIPINPRTKINPIEPDTEKLINQVRQAEQVLAYLDTLDPIESIEQIIGIMDKLGSNPHAIKLIEKYQEYIPIEKLAENPSPEAYELFIKMNFLEEMGVNTPEGIIYPESVHLLKNPNPRMVELYLQYFSNYKISSDNPELDSILSNRSIYTENKLLKSRIIKRLIISQI